MKVHVNKIPDIVVEFMNTRIVPKAPTALGQFGYGFVVPYVSASAQNMVNQNGIAKALGIIGTDDMIDIEIAKKNALSALEKAGGKVQLFGIVFSKDDFDALYDMAQRRSV